MARVGIGGQGGIDLDKAYNDSFAPIQVARAFQMPFPKLAVQRVLLAKIRKTGPETIPSFLHSSFNGRSIANA